MRDRQLLAQQAEWVQLALQRGLISRAQAASVGVAAPTYGEAPRRASGRQAASYTALVEAAVDRLHRHHPAMREALRRAFTYLRPTDQEILVYTVVEDQHDRDVARLLHFKSAKWVGHRRQAALQLLALLLWNDAGAPVIPAVACPTAASPNGAHSGSQRATEASPERREG